MVEIGGDWDVTVTTTSDGATTGSASYWIGSDGLSNIAVPVGQDVDVEVQLPTEARERGWPGSTSAQRRARRLLGQHLTPRQQHDYRYKGYFDLRVASRHRYRIHREFNQNVRRGDRVYCAQPTRTGFQEVPVDDVVLAQKLLLEANEEEFLEKADVFDLNLMPVS